jgi:hypothetical protein
MCRAIRGDTSGGREISREVQAMLISERYK